MAENMTHNDPGFCRVILHGVVFLAVALHFAGVAAAGGIKEPKTGVVFQESLELNGKTFQLSGVGLKTKYLFKVYAEALYLESSSKETLATFRNQAANPGVQVFEAVIHGDFGKLFVLHFVRNAGYERIQDAFKDGLKLTMNVDAPDVKADVDAFLRSFKDDVLKGQELKIYVEKEQVSVISPSGAITVIKNAKIALGTSECWLGKKAEQQDLRRDLLNRLSAIL